MDTGIETRPLREEEKAHLSFRSDLWLRENQLSIKSVISYFSTSVFYDHDEQLRNPTWDYVVAFPSSINDQTSELYVIHKLNRVVGEGGKVNSDVLAIYYCLYGTIFKAPVIRDIFSSRMTNALQCVEKSFAVAEEILQTDYLDTDQDDNVDELDDTDSMTHDLDSNMETEDHSIEKMETETSSLTTEKEELEEISRKLGEKSKRRRSDD